MRAVWKFPVPLIGEVEHDIPLGAVLLHVHEQTLMRQNHAVAWFEVDLNERLHVRRTFTVFATGESVADGAVYVGTVHVGWTVWHLYELAPTAPQEPENESLVENAGTKALGSHTDGMGAI